LAGSISQAIEEFHHQIRASLTVMAAGYEVKIADVDGEEAERWCAAIDNVERAVRVISVAADVTDQRRVAVVRNLSMQELRSLGIAAGGIKRLVKHRG
jgi:hypothetical protein